MLIQVEIITDKWKRWKFCKWKIEIKAGANTAQNFPIPQISEAIEFYPGYLLSTFVKNLVVF